MDADLTRPRRKLAAEPQDRGQDHADLTFFCNDTYLPTLGVKQKWALGSRSDKVWEEIWSDIGPRIDTVLRTNTATYDENLLLFLERSGYPEETYHTFSYSPLANDEGAVVGMLCVVTEETEKVIGERRLAMLSALGARLTGILDETDLFPAVAEGCGNTRDLPFVLTLLEGPGATLVPALPAAAGTFDADMAAFLKDRSLAQGALEIILLPENLQDNVPRGPWPRRPSQAVAVPFSQAGAATAAGYLVVGLNPFRRLDADYTRFLELIAGQIGASLTNARIHDAERKRAAALAEIDRAKTVFFSNVSHEFRTPLTLMLTPLEEVLAGHLPDANRSLLEVAHRNSLRLLKLVNSLLDFSRLEAGRVQAAYAPVDLGAVTGELASNFRSAMEKAGLTLKVETAALPGAVYIDRDMWEKVVLNLLSNAFKFTFAGTVSVIVKPAPDGKAAQVIVQDTGTGIPPAELPHLFERFRRVEGARSRSYEGSGIGLALVQELVRLHGGEIAVNSEVDRGTAFTITLPFGAGHLPAARVGAGHDARHTTARVQAYVDEALGWLNEGGADERAPAGADDVEQLAPVAGAADYLILLADDNADMRGYVRRLLRTAGYRVEAVTDGRAALEAARRSKPDLVLSDVMMPHLDGFGLLNAMRDDPGLRNVPVLLLSARAGGEARIEGLRAGADDYLTKPFTAAELLARVEVQIRLAQMRKESARALEDEAAALEALNTVGNVIAAEIDLERMVQAVTDAATRLSGAAFGAFFYNVVNSDGESYMLYTLSGVPREAFSKFPQPRSTAVFAPTFKGEGIVRSDDITQDPRFGRSAPYHGMPKGHLPVVSYLAVPVKGQSGGVVGGLFFGHSSTGVFDERAERIVAGIAIQAGIAIDKARLIRSLRESEQTLERKVVERTAELSTANARLKEEADQRARAEEGLRQAQKMESIGQLTGGVAHDFNNLLTIIIGNLEALQRQVKRGQDAATINNSAEQAMRGAKRAASLTDRLLAFARRQPLDPKPLDLSRLVSNMSDMLRRSLGEQVSLQTILGGGLWPVMADPNQLEIAVLNLAVNARDAMPRGGRLTIETANTHLDEAYTDTQVEVVPGQYAMIAVTDNGTGMPPEVVSKAFEPFFTTKDVGHGTGLGLSQVYGFVKQSGGHVKIYSEPGAGTSVKIYLPRLQAAGAVEEAAPAPALPQAAHAETILAVEDDEDVRTHTTNILKELGYNVLVAPEGPTALKVLADNPEITLLFTDVGLPGMTGRELADKARAMRPELKVLFTTGYARNAIVHGGRLDPGVQLITKPFTFADLARKIRAVLEDGQGEGRVLVVEDEALIQMLAAEMLQDAGLTSDLVSTATDALNKLRLRPDAYDAAVIDYGLPDRSGEELVREIRAFRPDLPIIVATGRTLDALPAGGSRMALLPKPYTQDQFYNALRAVGVALKAPQA